MSTPFLAAFAMAHTAGIGAAITIEHGHDTINIVTERVAHQRKQVRDISD